VGLFATKARIHRADRTAAFPRHFEAVGEALALGADPREACDLAGRRLSQDGAALEEVLDALRATTQLVSGSDPSYDAVRAVSVAWSETTLAYLHQISCEDPLTGLSSLAHVRARIADLYRAQSRTGVDVHATFGLVVIELPYDRPGAGILDDGYSRALRLARVGQSARTVFDASETIGRLGTNRVAAIVERDEQLGRRVALLRTLLDSASFPTRVWIEGLPGSDVGAAHLLDELARA
jgi:hypothetical protein